VSNRPQFVTLGLDPRALNLTDAQQVQSPRVKPKGDDRGWGNPVPPAAFEEPAQ
jgi:hypothetical protein